MATSRRTVTFPLFSPLLPILRRSSRRFWLARLIIRLWSVLNIAISAMYNLVSLNINGLNDHLKGTALIDWLKCMKADIVCLQETQHASHRTTQGWFRNSGFRVASSSTSVKRCRTAILVKDLYTITQVRKDDDGRFSQVEVDLAGDKLRFVSLYVPNTNPSRNCFFLLSA